jgi:hypothetical protein
MSLAIVNGILTSIALETVVLRKGGMDLATSFKTAVGMSLVSMIAMETTMNLTDWVLTGGALLTWWAYLLCLSQDLWRPGLIITGDYKNLENLVATHDPF